ncbi:DNA polymerase III subunit delta [Aeromonas hydrophila]|nr:DNA polymerase III subunit delta [Aeromonas hydrophila]
MRVYPEQFADHLKAGLKPCCLIFGDEPLFKNEQAIDRASFPLNQAWL